MGNVEDLSGLTNNKSRNRQTFQHPPYKTAENISKTDVKYEAPRTPTNEYDVELYRLKMEQLNRDKPFRIAEYTGVFGLAIAGVIFLGVAIFKSMK